MDNRQIAVAAIYFAIEWAPFVMLAWYLRRLHTGKWFHCTGLIHHFREGRPGHRKCQRCGHRQAKGRFFWRAPKRY